MTLKSKITALDCAEEVKAQALKWVEIIEKYAPCEPEIIAGISKNWFRFQWKSGGMRIEVSFGQYAIYLRRAHHQNGKFKSQSELRNPTEQDFKAAFE